MSLKARIAEDMIAALRARQTERQSTMRLLVAAIEQRKIDTRTALDGASVVAAIDNLIKQRRDSLAQCTATGRQDLAGKEQAEIEDLSAHTPQALSAAEVDDPVRQAIADDGAASARDMGKVMAWLKPWLMGRADMTVGFAQVKAALG